MAVQKPKTATKRKSSVRVAKKKRGVSKLQAIVLIGVLAAIGVVAVALTRASGTPNYQYSWSKYCVADRGTSSAAEVKKCKQTSAEAIVYRLYRGLSDRNPDDGGYKFWTQEFAGDRAKVSESALVSGGVAKMGSDTAFVKAVYRNMLDREATDNEMVSWRTKIKENKITRQRMIVQFAVSNESITKNETRWTAFAASAPRVNVVQTAAQEQRKRFDAMLLDYQQPAKKDMDAATAALATANAQVDAADATAGKKVPTLNDLKSISANQSKAQTAYNQAKGRAASAQSKEAAAKRLFDRAKELADFATDIRDNQVYGLSKIGDRYRATKTYAATANSRAVSAKSTVGTVSSKYAVAEKKYNDEQNRLAQIAAANAKKAAEDAKKAAANAKKAAEDAANKLRDQWVTIGKARREADCKKLSYSVFVDLTRSYTAMFGNKYVLRYRDVILYAGETQCLSRTTAPYIVDFGGGRPPNYPAGSPR